MLCFIASVWGTRRRGWEWWHKTQSGITSDPSHSTSPETGSSAKPVFGPGRVGACQLGRARLLPRRREEQDTSLSAPRTSSTQRPAANHEEAGLRSRPAPMAPPRPHFKLEVGRGCPKIDPSPFVSGAIAHQHSGSEPVRRPLTGSPGLDRMLFCRLWHDGSSAFPFASGRRSGLHEGCYREHNPSRRERIGMGRLRPWKPANLRPSAHGPRRE